MDADVFLTPDADRSPERLRDRFPWLRFLTVEEQTQFGAELAEVGRTCADSGEISSLRTELHAWRKTAAAKAAGYVPDSQLTWYEKDVHVMTPLQTSSTSSSRRLSMDAGDPSGSLAESPA